MISMGQSTAIYEKMFSDFSKECDTNVNQWNIGTVIEMDTSMHKKQKYYKESHMINGKRKDYSASSIKGFDSLKSIYLSRFLTLHTEINSK